MSIEWDSLILGGNELYTVGPATENARRIVSDGALNSFTHSLTQAYRHQQSTKGFRINRLLYDHSTSLSNFNNTVVYILYSIIVF